jgi:lysozyme family protein
MNIKMSNLKKETIDEIIRIEGGYVDDPNDSGGETKYGITVNVARNYGYRQDMKLFPRSLAFEIYSKIYWDSMRLDDIEKLSEKIAKELADTGVNMGTARAGEFLQRSLNVLNNRGELYADIVVDGDIGKKTIKTLKTFLDIRGVGGENVLHNMLNCLQGAFYVTLAERRTKDEAFVYGWFKNRVNMI